MALCNGCGGIIGRDCYNPRECEQISHDMAYQAHFAAMERAYWEEQERAYWAQLEADYATQVRPTPHQPGEPNAPEQGAGGGE